MTKIRPLLAIAALLVGLMLFAACDDDGDNDNDTGGSQPTAGATTAGGDGDGNANGAGDGNGDGEENQNGDGDGDGGGNTDELADIAQRFADASFRGEYTLTGAPDDDFGAGTLIMYKDGVERIRFDLSAEQDGETTSIILISTSETSAFCLENAGEFALLLGIPEDQGICVESDPAEGTGAGDFADIVDEIESGDFEIVSTSEREIAGEDADCYETRDTAGEVSNICFSGDGYLLSATEPDGSGLEATGVSGDVSDSNFDLPYELTELPDFDAPIE